MRLHTATGRPLLPWIIIAAVVVLAAVVASVAYGAADKSPSAAPTSAAPTASAEPSAPATSGAGDGDTDAAPTGCIAGDARTPAMVLAAQKKAPHTTYGAVETAAAFYRWAIQGPYPSASDVNKVKPLFTAAKADASAADLRSEYADGTPPSGLSKSDRFYLSTAAGYWVTDPNSTTDRITVSINANYVINGAMSPTKALAESFVMVWEDGAWHLDELTAVDMSQLNAGGTRFTAGC
jgi:hypothetical protein